MMKWVLCRVLGHHKTLAAFASNRFSCRRCGADLGYAIPVLPSPPAATVTHPKPRRTERLGRFGRERPLPASMTSAGTIHRHTRSRRGLGAPNEPSPP